MFLRQVLYEDFGCATYVVADGGDATVLASPRASRRGRQPVSKRARRASPTFPTSPREAGDVTPLDVRSSIAASLLKRRGVDDLIHVADEGVADLAKHGVEFVGAKSAG